MKRFNFSRLALCVLCGAIITVMPGLAFAGWVSQNSGTTRVIYSVYFPVDALTGYAAGDSGTILKTTNGGAVWVSQTSGTTHELNSLHFLVDALTGYAAGDSGTILKTTNGGGNWVSQRTDSIFHLYGIYFPATIWTGYAVGDSCTILNTTNGGANWAYTWGGAGVTLFSVNFTDAQIGYAVGELGIIETYFFGSWNHQMLNPPAELRSVYFPMASATGYIVGEGGTILKTTNGGAAWDTQTSGTTIRLSSVHFPVGVQTGYAAGDFGAILKTTDGGTNWVAQASGTINDLNSIHFPADASTGYAVGQSGTILKTTDGGTWVEETGGSRQKAVGSIKAMPNPFTSFATVPGHEGNRFEMYDVLGRQVGIYRGDRVGEGLVPGVYFLRELEAKAKPVRIVKIS